MSYFFVLCIAISDAIALAYLSRRSVGRTLALSNLAQIAVLYAAGLFLRLDVGMYVWLALSVGVNVAAAVVAIRRRDAKGVWTVCKNPVLWIYLTLGITVGIAFYNQLSHDFDEMSHWALVVKNMLTYHNFGNIGDTTTMFNRYVPATGVWMYAFQFFNPAFVNGNCYAAFDMLLISLLLPIPERFGARKTLPWTVGLLGSIVLVTILKCNIYFNLRVDALIGVMGAYIYLVYWADRGHADGFTVAEMSLGCAVLCLSKTSGLALAGIALALVVLDVLLRGRGNLPLFFAKKRRFAYLLLPILAIVLAKVSWNVYCNVNAVRAGWDASELTMGNLWLYLTQPNEFQRTVTALFWKNFFVGRVYWGAGSVQLPFVLLFPLFTFAGVVLWRRGQHSFAVGIYTATVVVLVAYAVVNLLLYIFSFSYGESLRLASYPRYYGTILTLMMLIWLALLTEATLGEKALDAKHTALLWRWGTVSLLIFEVTAACVLYYVWQMDAERTLRPYRQWLAVLPTLQDTDRVYYAATDENTEDADYAYLLVRYLATPTRCSGWQEGGNYANGREGGDAYTGDCFRMSLTVEELADALSNYDYFFLDDAKPEFVAKYASLFDGDIQAGVLYTITADNDSVHLAKAGV